MSRWRLLLLLVPALALLAWLLSGLGGASAFEQVLARRAAWSGWAQAHPLAASGGFLAGCTLWVSTGLPVVPLAFAAGALFGLTWGLPLVSFAGAAGCALTFLASRWLLGDWVRRRLSHRQAAVQEGLTREGPFFVFMMRMTPVIPLVVVNLLMGVTAIRLLPFYLATQLGMLTPLTVFVNAGSQLARVHSAAEVLSPGLLASIVAVGALPLATRILVRRLRRATGHHTDR